ncbi:similar to Saccharomyces cerevisiae YDR052C DBF4 Regulatory subunit of Cdc7p-Dbf4p kinase complex, required for Cdc7p kinase activity and initiation of DNA replication [Maudiozyma saulgeensis]|uniref:Similar to Saccharomyces cerevisiae YDR052C DBF4 Regulatory subunit of Cdc7p-Dbf4p kinase complex, required for Cdc7p kinase activity and initiation of DNA replication n=1 Tax=Maudiozyma saulgeensis TaxID=1789683 RepID=A0A1X7R3V3_9SACH|nr:similar to Saccharomyces cerevisiae YDR052C DBF4 Regulatory subunit of Cdc7p-Dbf4p kinase complex, required for Cdc7p kinase activity and initiation of DNA replication [Kazachstania saulgeensis]
MASPTKVHMRSPLKETDANMKQLIQPIKKRLIEQIDLDDIDEKNNNDNDKNNNNKKEEDNKDDEKYYNNTPDKCRQTTDYLVKRPKIERARSIEGAVLVSKKAVLKTIEPKVTQKDLLEWQNNWRKIMKYDSKIYFDITEDPETTVPQKRILDKKQELLKRGFLSLGAKITSFFDNSVTIVITRRDTTSLVYLNSNDVLRRAKRHYMKLWMYEKAARFLGNLDVDLEEIANTYNSSIATTTLSNLLQNEKLYGPNDRDPRTKRDDTHYFKYPHVYLYDLWQTWSPVITLEWKYSAVQKKDELPYPTLKGGSFGRCPFVGDRNCNESGYKRVVKRYARDKLNKNYAIKLRKLYQLQATPYPVADEEVIFLPHDDNDSKSVYNKWQTFKKTSEKHPEASYDEDFDNSNNSFSGDPRRGKSDGQTRKIAEDGVFKTEPKDKLVFDSSKNMINVLDAANNKYSETTHFPNKPGVYKEPPTPKLKRPVLASFTRQDTEDYFPDDLCNSKRQSHINYEIKASGAHQSNDVATSFGNGLGPTKASVMSKNIKTLSRFVVDRKLTIPSTRKLGAGKLVDSQQLNQNNVDKNINDKNAVMSIATSYSNGASIKNNATTLRSVNSGHATANPQPPKAPVSQPKVIPKDSGYCENCRVKYDSLESHLQSEKHISFADNSMNFEAIDTLIGKLKFQF